LRHVFIPVALAVASGAMAFASQAAWAGGHYTEVWNPPYAQTTKAKTRAHNLVPVQAKKKHKGGLTVKRIADKSTLAPPTLSAAVPATPRGKAKSSAPNAPGTPGTPNMQLPPLIGPNGQVLRVGYSGD